MDGGDGLPFSCAESPAVYCFRALLSRFDDFDAIHFQNDIMIGLFFWAGHSKKWEAHFY